MPSRPLVSVGLPTFNRAASLKRAIESVLRQDYSDLELVISDNASSDQTESLCADYRTRDKRVTYVRQATNRGATANFHEVLNQSNGEYFMWLGDDDWLHPSYISRCLETLEAHRDCSLVCGISKYMESGKLTGDGVKINLIEESPSERVLAFYRQVVENGTFFGLIRREELVRLPIRQALAGDWLLIAALAFRVKILTLEDTAIFRSRGGSSEDWENLARILELSKANAKRPYRVIAVNVLKDIAWQSPVYACLGTFGRWSLGWKALVILYNRFRNSLVDESSLLVVANKIRYRLKIRSRLKRALLD